MAPHRTRGNRLATATVAAVALCVSLCPAQSTTRAAPGAAAEVDALIARLSGDDWRDRQRAEDRLVLLGAAAEAKLRATARSAADNEVRARAAAALARIAADAVSGPTIVSLALDEAQSAAAVAALAAAAGVELPTTPPTLFERRPGPPLSLRLDHVPFWEAARRVLVPAGLEFKQVNDELRVGLVGNEARMAGPATVSGPFLVVAHRVERSHTAQLRAADLAGGGGAAANAAAPAGGSDETNFTVRLGVFAEPKLRVLRAASAVRLERAVDENGLSLLPARPARGGELSNPRVWTSSVRLEYPDGAGRTIAHLKGEVLVTLQLASDTAEVHDLLNADGASGTVAGVPFEVRHFKRLGERDYELVISVPREARAPEEWDRVRRAVSAGGVRVLDAEGRPLVRGVPSTNVAADRVDLTIRFTVDTTPDDRPAAEPATMVWEVPTETKDVAVPFEFENLPIP